MPFEVPVRLTSVLTSWATKGVSPQTDFARPRRAQMHTYATCPMKGPEEWQIPCMLTAATPAMR